MFDFKPLFYTLGIIAVGFVLSSGLAIGRHQRAADLQEQVTKLTTQTVALTRKLAAAEKQKIAQASAAKRNEASFQEASFQEAYGQQQKCAKDLGNAKQDLVEARFNAGRCPSNCGALDCRQIENMLLGLQACLKFADSVKEHLGPGKVATRP